MQRNRRLFWTAGWGIAGLSLAILFGLCREGNEEQALPAGDVSSSVEGGSLLVELASRYRPIYLIQSPSGTCGAGERYLPLPVEMLLTGDASVRLHHSSEVIFGPSSDDLASGEPTSYLDLPGRSRNPGCSYVSTQERLSSGFGRTTYARIAREEGHDGFALQFWTYWLFNDWNNVHESDWEMVQLVFASPTVDDALSDEPETIAYSQHGGGERRPWTSEDVVREGDRPAVFVSQGSHASYFRPAVYVGRGEDGSGLGCDIATGPHVRVDPSVVPLTTSPAPAQAWISYSGRWGERQSGEFNGPTGPSTKRAWREPLSWTEDLRTGSATIPGKDALGRNSVRDLCDVITTGSRALRLVFEWPALLAAGLVIPGTVLAFTSLVVGRDALRGSHIGWHRSGFLRRERRLGQIVRGSVSLFVQHPRLFVSIAEAYAPVQLAASLVGAAVINAGPFERLLWLFDSNPVAEFTTSLLFGGATSVVSYLFVVSASAAATARLDRGLPCTAATAYSAVFRHLPHIAAARLMWALAVAALAATIIGLPIAVWLSLRWFWIEEAVALDDRAVFTALGESAAASDGQLLRAIARIGFFAGSAAFSGMLVGAVLLFLTALPLWAVNVGAGLVHLLILPVAAIGLSLSYGDLMARAAATNSQSDGTRFGRTGRAFRLPLRLVEWRHHQ